MKGRKMAKKKNEDFEDMVEIVAREIHYYMSYATLATYHTFINAINANLDPIKRAASEDLLSKMLITSESLYEDLTPKQKELINGLALVLIKKITSLV